MRGHGQIRRSQIITTYGPGALIDLPRHSGIVAGLDTWPNVSLLEEVVEPRLSFKMGVLTGLTNPRLFAPPADENDPSQKPLGIGVWLFPEWFIVQEKENLAGRQRSRRLVHRKALDEKRRYDGLPVVAIRFLRACPKGHVDDVDWHSYIHENDTECNRKRPLWLDERGTSGDLADLYVRCECGKQRSLYEATVTDANPLGFCRGSRPWLGYRTQEDCQERSRLLIRTASNAYFPQVFTVLSLPDRGSAAEVLVRELWDDLNIVDDPSDLKVLKKKPHIANALKDYSDEDIVAAVLAVRLGSAETKAVKHVELAAILEAPEGYGDDVPVDEKFHARKLPEATWRKSGGYSDGIESIIQLHRLREVMALIGFTRFEAMTPDINGEYETDVERASIALDPSWFPATENRGEGIFIQLRSSDVSEWLERPGVASRLDSLRNGHYIWTAERKISRPFPGGPYVLLHTLSHLLLQSLSMRCGYPASSIRERIYANNESGQFGILLYTGSPDAEGTLGGLVQQGRYIEEHLIDALRSASLCSNDPICSAHEPDKDLEKRLLQGACCHGCALIAETSCEMRNDYLDRALVVPVLGCREAAFFKEVL